MCTLLSFISNEDPFTHGLIEGLDKPGTLLQLLETRVFTRLAILELPGLEKRTKQTLRVLEARFPHINIHTQPISKPNFNDMTSVLSEIKAIIERCVDSHACSSTAFIHTPPHMPELQSALALLKATGALQAELIQLEDFPYFSCNSETLNTSYKPLPTRIHGNALYAAQPGAPFLDDILRDLNLIGEDPQFQKAIRIAAALAEHDTPILIQGETGTGKDLFTRLIHQLSARSQHPLTIINCATLPEPLTESILFGHTKGSFSGATSDRIGKLEHADGGTLFLDELGELSPNNQSKLLRVIEDGLVEPLGSHVPRKVNIRIITATNMNLQEAVRDGRFREDLYYRLSVGQFYLPALRERPSDIPRLALHFLDKINKSLKEPKQLSQESLTHLERLPFPGNIRDLRNTIERAAMLSKSRVLTPEDLYPATFTDNEDTPLPALTDGFSLEDYLSNLRRRIINKAIAESTNNKSLAARKLGISPQAVHKFIKTELKDFPENN
jgi:transcriptional regulator with AAA-type ATPase domain